MKLMFIQGGTRLKQDDKGRWYTDSNFNNEIWDRYKSYCDELTVVLRREPTIYESTYASKHFSPVNEDGMRLVAVPDLYRPAFNYFSPLVRHEINLAIENAVKECDKVIIRSAGNYYATYAGKCCKRHDKPYLSEVTGFIYENLMWHGSLGKIMARSSEKDAKALIFDASHACYVTDHVLQERYPCSGKCLACSDVQIEPLRRLPKRTFAVHGKGNVKLGTAAALDVALKGHIFVVDALAELKAYGLDEVTYELAGLGSGTNIRDEAAQRGVLNQVTFVGGLPHENVLNWLDSIDIYIQPSFQEGLSRSIIEAMSRACPVIATDVGGNSELIDKEWLVPAGDAEALAKKIKKMIENPELAIQQSEKNLEKSKIFDPEKLNAKRDTFYRDFTKGQ